MYKFFQRSINNLIIFILTIGVTFCLFSCDEKVDLLTLALDSLKLEVSNISGPINLAKQLFYNYEGTDYCFDITWSYTNEENWKDLIDCNSYYLLEPKKVYDDFQFELVATIAKDKNIKSKSFSGHYCNIDTPLTGIDLLYSLNDNEEATIQGIAISIYDDKRFVFQDENKSIVVQAENSNSLLYETIINITLRVRKTKLNLNGQSYDKVTAEFISYKLASSVSIEIQKKYKNYDLKEIYNAYITPNKENFDKLNQVIIKTSGLIDSDDQNYFVVSDNAKIKIANVDASDFKLLLGECIGMNCSIDFFVNPIIEENVLVDYEFLIIDIFL